VARHHHDPREVLTRPAPPADFTVAYGDDPEHVIDVRLPAPSTGGTPRPLVVFVHGGFWMAEYDRVHAAPLATDLASRGYPVASVEYRRIGQPGGGYPGTLDDVATAVGALPELVAVAQAERGVDAFPADRPVLMGHSAGGHLALWTAARGGPEVTRGVLALAPVADLARAYRLRLGNDAVRLLLGGGPGDVPDRYAAADPSALLPIGVPVAVVHGHLDEQVPYPVGADFVAAARRAGDEAHLFELPEAEHFALIDPLSAAWSAVLDALELLVRIGHP